MEEERQTAWNRRLTFAGVFLLMCSTGFVLYVGNLVVYVYSFYIDIYEFTEHTCISWLLSIFNITKTVGLILANLISKRVGLTWTVGIGVFLFNAGFFASHFTISIALELFIFTLSALPGLAVGIFQASALKYLISWYDQNTGRTTLIITASTDIGAGFINGFITFFINPDNKIPTGVNGPFQYFEEPDIKDRVPWVFLYLGVVSLTTQCLAMVIMSEREKQGEVMEGYGATRATTPTPTPRDCNLKDVERGKCNTSTSKKDGFLDLTLKESCEDVEPKDLFKTSLFFFICLFVMAGYAGNFAVLYTYKVFGQMWIQDDYFLTGVSIMLSWGVIFARSLWAIACDRFPTSTVLMAFHALLGIFFAWFYICASLSRLTFVLCSLGLAFIGSGQETFLAPLALRCFGKKHFSTNYCIIMSSTIVSNLCVPLITHSILESFGWLFYYVSAYVCQLVPAVLIVVGFRIS